MIRQSGMDGDDVFGAKASLRFKLLNRRTISGKHLFGRRRFRKLCTGLPSLEKHALLPEIGPDLVKVGHLGIRFGGVYGIDAQQAHNA